jgi:hypothetical protein
LAVDPDYSRNAIKSFEIHPPSSPDDSLPELVTDEKTVSMGFDFALTDEQIEEIGALVAAHLGIEVLEDQMIAHRSWVSSKPDKWVRHLTLGK